MHLLWDFLGVFLGVYISFGFLLPNERECHFSPPKSDEKAPLIFGSTCRTKLLTKPQHSSLPDFEAPKAVVAKFSPQRQPGFSVIFSATNFCSSIVRRSAVKTAQCGSINCRALLKLGHGMLNYIIVHRRSLRITEKGHALTQM